MPDGSQYPRQGECEAGTGPGVRYSLLARTRADTARPDASRDFPFHAGWAVRRPPWWPARTSASRRRWPEAAVDALTGPVAHNQNSRPVPAERVALLLC